MTIEKEPFVRYSLEEKEAETINIRLNKEEWEQLEQDKKILNQAKDGTAIKQLMKIGSYVLHSQSTGVVIDIIFKNKDRNKRTGIQEF